jgi:small subunit ribosomal protein S1
MSQEDKIAALILERKENLPEKGTLVHATILAKNSNGLYLDINKNFEGYVSKKELGDSSIEQFNIGDSIEVYTLGEDKNQDGLIKLSVKQIQEEQKWHELEELLNKSIEVEITKIVKSGAEAKITTTGHVGFIPNSYLDTQIENLRNKKPEEWLGVKLPVKLHELEKSKNKIIFNHKIVSQEIREAKTKEIFNSLSIGQHLDVTIIRLADFGVFVDLNGVDALIPASELSWQRFDKPKDIHKVGDKLRAQVFKLDPEGRKIALSVKKIDPNPWISLPEELKPGHIQKAKVVSQADFGVFVEMIPGVEALLHKSNYETVPEKGAMIEVEIKNIELDKKRMGVGLIINTESKPEMPKAKATQAETPEAAAEKTIEAETTEEVKAAKENNSTDDTQDQNEGKELEHVG